jgi:hypothetical protein
MLVGVVIPHFEILFVNNTDVVQINPVARESMETIISMIEKINVEPYKHIDIQNIL